MTDPANLRQVRLSWTGEGLVFRGGPDGGPVATLDSDGKQGLSSTHYLLFALAGCMAVDVKMILEKSRVPLESIEVNAEGERAETPPRKFVRIRLTYEVKGPLEEHEKRLQNAIDLSRDKYCSVMHSLDPNIEIDIRVRRV
jgi:putative redox protein